jgi:hypothetical protein
MKKIELKEKMIEKNMIKMTNFIKGNYEIISWIIEGEGQEVEGVIYYFQVPVLKQV